MCGKTSPQPSPQGEGVRGGLQILFIYEINTFFNFAHRYLLK